MSAPRQQVNPLTKSVGFDTRLVTIMALTDTTAVCADRTGVEVRVPLLIQRAKGQLPQVGDNWLINQDIGQWVFQAFIGTDASDYENVKFSVLEVGTVLQIDGGEEIPAMPSGAGVLYVDQDGNLHYLGPQGTDTIIAGP